MSDSFILIVTEGALEIPVALRLLRECGIVNDSIPVVDKHGRESFWRDIDRYNRAAANVGRVFGLADLETQPCASGLIQKYLRSPRNSKFILRIAVRMLESWLLADVGLAQFLKIGKEALPREPDSLANPKLELTNLARRSKLRRVREDLVPEFGSSGLVGKGYTPLMTDFIESHWNPMDAARRSNSLKKAIEAIQKAIKST